MFDIVLNIGEVHEFKALDSVAGVELLLGLVESADHENINFVVFTDIIFAFLYSFD